MYISYHYMINAFKNQTFIIHLTFRETSFDDCCLFWITAIRKPEKLLTSLIFEFSVKHSCSVEDVELVASIHREQPEMTSGDSVVFTGMTIQSANIDPETKRIIPAHYKQCNQHLPFVKICFRKRNESPVEKSKKNLYDCPVYETVNR